MRHPPVARWQGCRGSTSSPTFACTRARVKMLHDALKQAANNSRHHTRLAAPASTRVTPKRIHTPTAWQPAQDNKQQAVALSIRSETYCITRVARTSSCCTPPTPTPTTSTHRHPYGHLSAHLSRVHPCVGRTLHRAHHSPVVVRPLVQRPVPPLEAGLAVLRPQGRGRHACVSVHSSW